MANKKSEVRRHDAVVRLDKALVEKARKVATLRGLGVAEYLSESLKPIVDRDFHKTLASEMAKASKASKGESDTEK